MITLNRFVGNQNLMRLLQVSILAAKETNSALPHILLKGPAGTGKTTLAEAIAREFGTEPRALTPGSAKSTEALRKLFLSMPGEGYDQEGKIIGKIQPQIVFIDEIHQLSLVAQENLGIAMQDWKLPIRINNEDVFEWVPRFTIIGATTLAGKLSKPFLDRFKIQSEFEIYSNDEALTIVKMHAGNLGIELGAGVAEAIARRSRGVARLMVRFLERLKDAAIVAGKDNPTYRKVITLDLTELVFNEFLNIDDRGLTRTDIKVLRQLAGADSPLGLETLATAANEDKMTISNTVEPYLMQEGLMAVTPRGRILTDEGRRYLISARHIRPNTAENRMGRVIG